MTRPFPKEHILGLAGLGLLAWGSYTGLVVAPPEKFMGDVGRILYIHVPTAWSALLAFTAAFFLAIAVLWKRSERADDLLEATIEVGVVLTAMLLIQGSIWAKPTWGVYWTWDPRLTTSAILLVAFIAVLAMRHAVDDPNRRATWTAVGAILAYVDVPLVYFGVKWWRTMHQDFSSPETVAATMVTPLRINAVAVLLIATWLVLRRARLARMQRATRAELTAPPTSTLVAGEEA